MNIYEKIQTMRVVLQSIEMKKSGKNKFAGYEYFELKDFLPIINDLMLKYQLTSNISFGNDMAVLTIINNEKPEETANFTSPMSTAELKGCHPVQNLGAVQTYLRRYLYMNAFEIVEYDPLDATTGEETKKEVKEVLTESQIKRAYAIAKASNLNEDAIKKWIKNKYGKESLKELNKKQYDELCTALENAKGQ
jgi:hypothetical protein